MVFAARQLQEKSMEQHQDLYMTFVDLKKAFRRYREQRGTVEGHVQVWLPGRDDGPSA